MATALFVVWLALGIAVARLPILDPYWHHRLGLTPNLLPYEILGIIGETIGLTIPLLAAVALVWAAFVRPQWSERALFSAALIVTAAFILAGVPQQVFYRLFHISYGNDWVMMGVVSYGPWFLFACALNKPFAAALCVVALLACFVAPLLIGYVEVFARYGAGLTDVIGSGLLGAAIVAAGAAVAEKVGAQVFAAADDKP